MLRLIFTFLLASFVLLPRSQAVELKEAQKLWDRYKACEKTQQDDDRFGECLDGVFGSKVKSMERVKLGSFLIMGYEFSALRACAKGDLKPGNTLKTQFYYCMDVLGKKSKHPGYILLELENKKPVLTAIKYSEATL
ncbi:hypothetical protein [Bdellovibrio sp. HCB337]|uniref:hypothetical protein n=1 Tax=Bdellovibrio sp. HCB337 TaxID=3394358 RepID=UPI0039A4674A